MFSYYPYSIKSDRFQEPEVDVINTMQQEKNAIRIGSVVQYT